ncbi:MAG: carboxylesterase/lipase family protein [Prevotella sp.]|nr:carboxylesterase/lipase family protein [Prevotella sp.]
MKNKIFALCINMVAGLVPTTLMAQNEVSGYSMNSSTAASAVETQYGKVAGYIENGVYNYKGIPYAEASRFEEPHAPKAWAGIRSSRYYGPTCPQEFRSTWLIDNVAFASQWDDGYPGEDCLRVNVWTQGIHDGKHRPVMVWIHGGGFSTGSGQEQPAYDGASLVRKGDVVVVSLNHRLNVLGFLNLSSFGERYKHTANLGLLDIVAALRWVRANISNFGGDPNNITIFGQSGGGRKVSSLLCMPIAKGLFHKAIVQSGSGATFMPDKYSRKIGELTVRNLGLTADRIAEIEKIPYADLLAAGTKACNEVKKEADAAGESARVSIWGWMPTKDGELLPDDAFHNGSEKVSADVPMIVGSCLNEFASLPAAVTPGYLDQSDEQVMAILHKMYGNATDRYVSAFRKAYPQLKTVDMPLIDFKYRPQALAQVETKAKDKAAPVWNYLFAYQSTSIDGVLKAMHCMELPYVFNNVTRCAFETDALPEAVRLGDVMSSAWINFARTGNPNGEGVPQWPDYQLNRKSTMVFDTHSEVREDVDGALQSLVETLQQKK